MTVTTTANSISYAGNGTTTAYSFPFIFFAPTDLQVTLVVIATDTQVSPAPVLNGGATYDYTVTGVVTHGEYASGGTVTFNTAPLGGWNVSLVRVVPAIQTVALVDNAKFPAETVNTEFDYLTVLAQQALAGGGGVPPGGGINQVVAGIGLSGGGTTSTVTIDLEAAAPGVVPIGGIVDFAGSVAPANWLLCQGQALATAGTYGVLFTVIGFTYGGGAGSFNLPDLGGRVTAGKETTAGGVRLTTAGAGLDGSVLGAAGGAQTYSLTLANLAAHTHALQGAVNRSGLGAAVYGAVGGADTFWQTPDSGSAGSGTAHQNTQPTMVLNKIIRFA